MKIKPLLILLGLLLTSIFGCSKQNDLTGQKKPAADTAKKGYDLDESVLVSQGYTKVFEENFSSDLSLWNFWEGGAYNNELQLYQRKNLKIDNGSLVITPVKEQATGKTYPESSDTKSFGYTSGRIESKFTYTPSDKTPKIRISARIQLPLGAGMWPAFWSYGTNWPTEGEIDILEALGDQYNYTTDYFYGKSAGIVDSNDELTVKSISSSTDLTNVYHVYEMVWTKNSLTFFLDGKVVDEKLSTSPGGEFIPAFYGKLEHITLNLAVGGDIFGKGFDNSTIKTSPMYVDWVRVYTSK
jgi:beta-glucanase (GH16 family)